MSEEKNALLKGYSEQEQEKLALKLWNLLKNQADRFNGLDSSSVTVERAQELLASALFTIELANSGVEVDLLQVDLQVQLQKGQLRLKELQKAVKVEFQLLCHDLPAIRNAYYEDTLANLGLFFKIYNLYYEAHQIPCSIDYWLMYPVSEDTKGILFVREYIKRLQLENDFLSHFPKNVVKSLYERYMPDYEKMFFNLCEPVWTNAVGCALLHTDIFSLNISKEQGKEILHLLEGKTLSEIEAIIKQAALIVCQQTTMQSIEEQQYFGKAAHELAVRLLEAVKHKDLSEIFLEFLLQEEEAFLVE